MNIIEAFYDNRVFGRHFPNKESWKSWEVFLKIVYGIPLEPEEKKLYMECTGRRGNPPKKGFEDFFAIIGRRGGKSRISALIGAYEALYGNWGQYLASGERANVFLLGTDMMQAKIVFKYIEALLSTNKDRIEAQGAEYIDLDNGVTILVKASMSRTVRGYSTAVVILDELAFFRTEESANPAEEIITAIAPTLLPGAKLIGISTPKGKWGYLYKIYSKNFAVSDSPVLIWKAPTSLMNPGLAEREKGRLFRLGLVTASTEYGAEFEEDLETYLPEEVIDAAIDKGVFVRPGVLGTRYFAFCDMSGGRVDSFTLAIAHREGNQILVDFMVERQPEIGPKVITKEFAVFLKDYGIYDVMGDRYGGDWPVSEFKEYGIRYSPSPKSKSKLYLEFAGVLGMGRARLLDDVVMKGQLLGLERRTSSVEDKVDHMRGMHDDLANSVAGVVVMVYSKFASRLSDEELEASEIRMIPKGGSTLTYHLHWSKILKKAEEEMEEAVAGRKEEKKEPETLLKKPEPKKEPDKKWEKTMMDHKKKEKDK